MTRQFASWADPTQQARSRGGQVLHNPFAGFAADIRQVGRYWRWGRGSHRPVSLLRLPADQQGERPSGIRQRLRDPFVGLLRWARVEVTGLTPSSQQQVVLAHTESPADLAVLLESLPQRWKVVHGRAPASLPRRRSLLLATDFASAAAADVVASAARLATRHQVPLVPIVVRRLTSGLTEDHDRSQPRPKRVDEVLVRYGEPIVTSSPVLAGQTALQEVSDLVAEDDSTWWQVVTGQVRSSLVTPMPSWRRQWERTHPERSAGRSRRAIWHH